MVLPDLPILQLKYYVGCTGWRNVPWKGSFYPDSVRPSAYLSYYASIFDFVEVNLGGQVSTPDAAIDHKISGIGRSASFQNAVQKWTQQTPDEFHFAIKVPNSMLFGKDLLDTRDDGFVAHSIKELGQFLKDLAPVREKVITLTVDVPYHLTLATGRGWLEAILHTCADHGYIVSLQFGSKSWFQDLAYNLLRRYDASIIWPCDNLGPPSGIVNTSNSLYLRMREASSESPGEQAGLVRLADMVKKMEQQEELEYAIIVSDNPTRATVIKQLLGMSPRKPSMPASNGNRALDTGAQADKVAERIIACVDLNAFYPSCEELRDPSLRGRPHAVIMTDQRAGEITQGVVSSCSYEARKYGVRSAMALSRALSLCPGLILMPVDIPYYSQVSEKVMSVLEPFGDVLEQASIDEAFIDCTSRIPVARDATALREFGLRIKQKVLQGCGLLCSVGIAPTKSAAKIASDYQKPDGLTVVTSDLLTDFLSRLEIGRISGIGPKTEKALKEMGIATIGELARADVHKLKARFGKNGLWMWQVANGTDAEPVRERGDHVSISTETTLQIHTHDGDQILRVLQGLADEISDRAGSYGYSFRTVGVKLVRADFSVESREVTYPEPQQGRTAIASALKPLLSKFELADKGPAVRKAGIRLAHLSRSDVAAPFPGKKTRDKVQRTLLDYP